MRHLRLSWALSCLLITLYLYSCNNYEAPAETTAPADAGVVTETTDSTVELSEYAASLKSPERKVIKNADMRCRVNDVYEATAQTEKLVNDLNGIVTESKLENQASDTRVLPYKPDSLKRVKSYVTTAHLALRVPVNKLDTLLLGIAAHTGFIDMRRLQVEDVTLQFKASELRQTIAANNDVSEKAKRSAHRTAEVIAAAAYADKKKEAQIDRTIETLDLREKVAFSTISIDFYQPEKVDMQIIPDIDRLMKPTFGQQAALGLNTGWNLAKGVLVGLINAWPLLLAAGIIFYFIYRSRKAKRILIKTVK